MQSINVNKSLAMPYACASSLDHEHGEDRSYISYSFEINILDLTFSRRVTHYYVVEDLKQLHTSLCTVCMYSVINTWSCDMLSVNSTMIVVIITNGTERVNYITYIKKRN